MQKSHTKEAEIAQKICSHIVNDPIYCDPNFDFELEMEIDLFKKYFNPIIHAEPYCLYNRDPKQRDEYNMFFRLAKGKVIAWLRRKKLAKEQVAQNAQMPTTLQSSRRGIIRVPTLLPVNPSELKHNRDLDF